MDDSIVVDLKVIWFISVSIDDISENDANIAFYVHSYIGHNITCQHKWLSCTTMMVKSEDISPPSQCKSNENAKFVELANCEGFCIPTQFCFVITI